jgi:hypothetical protein
MKRLASVIAALSLVAGSVSIAVAQAKPSFAGKWTLVPDPNAAATAGGRGGGRGGFGGLGQGGTIEQNDKTLTVTTTTQAGETKAVYNLDGTESKNPLSMGGNSIDRVSKVKWDGAKLVITTTTNFNGTANESTQTWSLDATGNLVIESTSNFGGNPTTTKQTYKKD